MTDSSRRSVAEVNLTAIQDNCRRLVDVLAQGAAGLGREVPAGLCAVVKADGYGHGIVQVAQAAMAGGATRLAVVTVDELTTLRAAGVAVPVLVMAPVEVGLLDMAVSADAELTAWSPDHVKAIASAAARVGCSRPIRIHVKLDTGMGRFGTKSQHEAIACLELCNALDEVEGFAVWTHFATADEDDNTFFQAQLDLFNELRSTVRDRFPAVLAHAANSAATLRDSAAHFDFVRCGIAIYGLDPFHRDPTAHGLKPALALRSYVAELRKFEAGDSAGYGRKWSAETPTWVATVPIGYGDGWRRVLSGRADVLIDGRRYRQVGTVSMDSITIWIGSQPDVAVDDDVVLIGESNRERIFTEEVAAAAGTINYEITCGLSARTRREYTAVA